MGTRHLIGVVVDGDFSVAQYGQWDGYPSGQGIDVLKFLRDVDLVEFAAQVRKVRFLTDADRAEIDARWAELGADDSGWISMEQSRKFYSDARFAPLSRDVGSDVLSLVMDGKVEFLADRRDFALDSLFCEWAYVLDLDAGRLEVYEGFQKAPPTGGRWTGQHKAGEDYAAVELREKWPLADLPSDAEFVACLESEEDDDD